MSLILRKLNAYPEWKTKTKIDDVAKYIQDDLLPPYTKTTLQKTRYKEKYGTGDFIVKKVGNKTRIFYNPSPRLSLEVLYPDEKEEILKKLFDDPTQGQGIGIRQFYSLVSGKYLNITRKEVTEFLRKQGNYSVTRPYNKTKYNKPVLAQASNERIGMDTIKMARYSNYATKSGADSSYRKNMEYANNGGEYTQILTMIDYYSKKVWAYPLVEGSSIEVNKILKEWIKVNETRPRIFHVDNGPEFQFLPTKDSRTSRERQGEEKGRDIKTIFTKPYSSTSNGLIERANSMLRNRIRAGFAKNNDLEWVKHLQNYVDNINNQKPQGGLLTPNQLWTQGYTSMSTADKKKMKTEAIVEPTDKSSVEDLKKYKRKQLLDKAEYQMEKSSGTSRKTGKVLPPKVFQEGDSVRVALTNSSVYPNLNVGNETNMKKRHKTGGLDEGKYSTIKYGLEIYTIHKIIKPAEMRGKLRAAPLGKYWNIGRVKYHLKKPDGKVLTATKDGYKKKPYPVAIYGSDLLLVDKDQSAPTVNSYDRIKEINRFTAYTPSQKEIDDTKDRMLKQQASFEEKQRIQREKEAADRERQKQIQRQIQEREEAERERQKQIQKQIQEMREEENKRRKKEEETKQRKKIEYEKQQAAKEQKKRTKDVQEFTKKQSKELATLQNQIATLKDRVLSSSGRNKTKIEKQLSDLRKQEKEIQALLERYTPTMSGTGMSVSHLSRIPFVDDYE
jgi:hypothetical protein